MRYFLDTEFNGFCGPLIALALVPEDESLPPFYAALECTEPTPWVAEHVLPVLGIAPVSRAEMGHAFARYLRNDPAPLLFADWPEDIAHAATLLVAGPGRRYPIDRIRFELCDAIGFDGAALSAVPHHPLHDAAALRAFILAREAQ
ncbi:hypothetical protein [Sphingomonas hengshuiensis]|uniref:Uncharacterized protein n=1 Tax=Sphingomonas hengshuiensis TaxID=1609977 RepID=A0A7U4LGS2_9SPHN|nr:hypothetical protein [Sphingomonas hengshuiensis]AJP73618.1 hypothetical protein TS85_20155 [Sphingomonas hengshuiensis]